MGKPMCFNSAADALQYVGLVPDALSVYKLKSGGLYRGPTLEHERSENGYFSLFNDGGFFCGNWETDETAIYSPKGSKPLSRAELAAAERKRKQEQRRRQAEKLQDEKAKAEVNRALYEQIKDEYPFNHPYLNNKHVYAPDGLAETTGAAIRNAYGFCFSCFKDDSRLLVMPLYCDGVIWGLQFIDEHGNKRFWGRTGGCYFPCSPLPVDPNTQSPIVIGEGLATVLSIVQNSEQNFNEACGVVALNCKNLKPVAVQMREKYRNAPILIFADRDKSGIGEKCADEARAAAGGLVIVNVPDFTAEDLEIFQRLAGADKVPTDWNDFYLIQEEANASCK